MFGQYAVRDAGSGIVWCPICDAEYRNGFSRCIECHVELRDTRAEGQSATLLTTLALDARVGIYRPGAVVDRLTGEVIGTAQRTEFPLRPGFSLRDTDDRELLRVTRRWGASTWRVFTAEERPMCVIVPGQREERRERLVMSRMGDPIWLWTGSAMDGVEPIAYIRKGRVVDASSGTTVASLHLSPVPWWKNAATAGTWRLRITDGVERRMRMVALAWLGVAFGLQRYIDAPD